MKLLLTLLVLTIALVGPTQAQIHDPLDALANGVRVYPSTETDVLKALEGERIIVTGVVSHTGKSGSGTNFVNYEGSEFHLVTFKSDLRHFEDGEPADIYPAGTRLAITGIVSVYRDKPQFKLATADGVRVFAEDEPLPEPTPKEEAEPEMKKEAEPEAPAAKEETEKKGPKKPPVDPGKYFK